MTNLLFIIIFILSILTVLAGIGAFNIKKVCDYCDFIHSEQYRNRGALDSINVAMRQTLINQDESKKCLNAIRGNILFNGDKIKTVTELLEDIKDNTAYEPDCFTTDDDLPFPIDEEPTLEQKDHFILTDNTTVDDIKSAYLDEKIAIHCTSEKEWKESIAIVSEVFEARTSNNEIPTCCDAVVDSFLKGKDFHCVQRTPLLAVILFDAPSGVGVVCGNLNNDDVEEDYTIVEWSDIRELFIGTLTDIDELIDSDFEPAEMVDNAENVNSEAIETTLKDKGEDDA